MKNTPAKTAKTTASVPANMVFARRGIYGFRRDGSGCKNYSRSRAKEESMKSNLRRLNCKVSAQTFYNLGKLAGICGYGDNLGKVVDKLVREKMLELRGERDE